MGVQHGCVDHVTVNHAQCPQVVLHGVSNENGITVHVLQEGLLRFFKSGGDLS